MLCSPTLTAEEGSETVIAHLESAPGAIKLLDLLTNRYHLGVVRESTHAALWVELPASSHLHAGQRVRFVLAGSQGLVSRMAMRRALITTVSPSISNRLSVQLAVVPESAVA